MILRESSGIDASKKSINCSGKTHDMKHARKITNWCHRMHELSSRKHGDSYKILYYVPEENTCRLPQQGIGAS